jgi:hypothetical protein
MSKPEDGARNRSDVGIGVDMQQNGCQPIFGKRNKTILTCFDWLALEIVENRKVERVWWRGSHDSGGFSGCFACEGADVSYLIMKEKTTP